MSPTQLDAGVRLRRLLAVLAWLAPRWAAPIAELADRFGMSAGELVADLELAACCGRPPYTPDQLMEIIVDEDEVSTRLGDEHRRPRRLPPSEGFALAAAARAVAATAGSDPDGALARALAKLEAALGDRGGVRVDLDEPEHLAAVRRAAAAGEQLEIEYYSASSDATTTRVVDPASVAAIEGRWYLDAWCHTAEGERRFRVDRILAARPTGAAAAKRPTPRPDGAPAYVPGDDATLARLSVAAPSAWVTEAVPVVSVTRRADGGAELVVAVESEVWLARLLLQLGPDAAVLDPPEWRDLAARAASAALARYEDMK